MATAGAHMPGTLHSGGVLPGTVHANPTREFQDRGMGQHTEHNRVSETHDSTYEQDRSVKEVPVPGPFMGRFGINKSAHSLLLLTQLLTIASFFVVLGALAALTHRKVRVAGTQNQTYNEVFQSGHEVPYPGSASRQFAFSWYILAMEIFVTLMILFLICMPRRLLRLKHVAMAFLVYLFVLTTLQVESLLFFRRSALANSLFSRKLILILLIGTIAGCICNGLSIIYLGLLRNKHEMDDYHNYPGGLRGKRVSDKHAPGAWGPGAHNTTGPAAV